MNDKPNDVIASKASEEYLDRAWALLDERVVTDATGSVDIIAELMMERDNLKSQINEYRINRHANVESTANASMEFSTSSDHRVKLLTPVPASPDELTVAVLGTIHSGKTILSVLIGRLLAQVGVSTTVVDEDSVLSPYYSELSTPDMVAVFNGDLVGRSGKAITITNKSVRRNLKIDPRFEPPMDKPIPVGAIISLPESPEIALGEIIRLRNT